MACDNYKPHVHVLPEDDANKDIANGFRLGIDFAKSRQLQILPVAGGWGNVLNEFEEDRVREMRSNNRRHMVLLIDFDGRLERSDEAKESIPNDLQGRVYILGTLTNPEEAKKKIGCSYEKIGLELAKDCSKGTENVWGHKCLQHNREELDRLRKDLRSIFFQ